MLYSIKNLKKIYNGRSVLTLPQLFIEKGKIYSLSGPNGSGKTTLLSILSFLDAPSEGRLFYNNKPVMFEEKFLHKLRFEVTLVNQHPIMFSTSVYKNIEFGLKLRKIDAKKREYIIKNSLEQVGMLDFVNAQAKNLSGGETQRVAIARALACSPKVILFDEPTASVDLSSQTAIENIICQLHSENKISIIISTHNQVQASRLAHEKIFLFEGHATSFTYENIFTGTGVCQDNQYYCLLNQEILMPVKNKICGKTKIAINPNSVKVFKPQNIDNNPEIFYGKVSQLTCEQDKVRLVVDIGIHLNIFLKKQEYMRLGLCIGDRLGVQCFEEDITII